MAIPVVDLTDLPSSPEKPPRKRQKVSGPVKRAAIKNGPKPRKPAVKEVKVLGAVPSTSVVHNKPQSPSLCPAVLVNRTFLEHQLKQSVLSPSLTELQGVSTSTAAASAPTLVDTTVDEFAEEGSLCKNCNQFFDNTTEHVEGECKYHSGTTKVDIDQLPDYDERCQEIPDSEEDKRDHPEWFVWDCCKAPLLDPGCEERKHVALNTAIPDPEPTLPPRLGSIPILEISDSIKTAKEAIEPIGIITHVRVRPTAPPVEAMSNAKETLQEAIRFMTDERLRHVLKTLAAENPAFETALMNHLLAPSQQQTTAAEGSNQVQAVFHWEVCDNCHEEYNAAEKRVHGECVYHPADMYPDVNHEIFLDHHEPSNGPMDTPEARKDFPDAFLYEDCCGRDGTSEGCETGVHTPAPHERKHWWES
ncbi:hypothetical protein CALCODRAFT_519669 [Calocera cornea HHB12733]|uniref:C2H2-type domain-containing protein n=1 Tax=Calocera cornea HHB12733 TaxID=1353952 RepID=A0A165E3X7_9BASI|nr:hypothetical protein CALCODRAFT_519669 [Calocera cornea HHB12733]